MVGRNRLNLDEIEVAIKERWIFLKKIELEVPDIIYELPEKEKNKLISSVFVNSIKERLEALKDEANEAKEKITKYQNKYSVDLESFEKEGLKDNSSLDEHDEYMDWYFWQKVYDESNKLVGRYRIFLGDEIDIS